MDLRRRSKHLNFWPGWKHGHLNWVAAITPPRRSPRRIHPGRSELTGGEQLLFRLKAAPLNRLSQSRRARTKRGMLHSRKSAGFMNRGTLIGWKLTSRARSISCGRTWKSSPRSVPAGEGGGAAGRHHSPPRRIEGRNGIYLTIHAFDFDDRNAPAAHMTLGP